MTEHHQPTHESAEHDHYKPPFANCSFKICDLPGQCRGEGKCHHPANTPVAAQAQEPVAYQVRRTDGSPLACWEPCTKALYDATRRTGRYAGFVNGPLAEVRALGVIGDRPPSTPAQPVSAADGLPTDLDALKLAYAEACEERDHLRKLLGKPPGNAGELKTDDQMGFVLAAIQHYGSQKWAEGKGLAPTELLNVREAWDAVYTSVQALAAQAQPPVSESLPYEQALFELIDKIDPGLDTGDLLADAATASKALSAQQASGQDAKRQVAGSIREPANGDGWRVHWWNESMRLMLPDGSRIHHQSIFNNGTMVITIKSDAARAAAKGKS